MTHHRSKTALLGAGALAIFIMSGVVSASAQQAPTLEDLEVINTNKTGKANPNQQNTQAAGYVDPASPMTGGSGYDPSKKLAADAAQQDPAIAGGSYQAAKPDLRYADPAQAAQIQRQAGGDYGSIERTDVPLGTVQDAWNQPYSTMSQGQTAPGTVHYHWSQDFNMPVRMREYMNTFIVLPSWEGIKETYLGEDTVFEVKKVRNNTIALHAARAGADTSLSILGTSGNLYTFYLRAEGWNTKTISDLNVFVDAAPLNPGVFFNGQTQGQPQGQGGSSSSQQGNVQPVPDNGFQGTDNGGATPANVEGSNLYIPSLDLKFVHKMYEVHPGDRAIAPEYVATDGRWTYFYYGAKAGTVDRPLVFYLNNGVEERVSTRTIGAKGETIVAEKTGEFVLRNGPKTICVKIAAPADSQ